ncbi:MAG: hypothetical protein ACKOOF_09545 [Planctomycetaceae bacterium]|jgi:hypothetical protein
MNTIDMTTDSADQHRGPAKAGACTLFTATINGASHLVRGLAVWPIDEALALEEQIDGSLADQSPALPLDAALMHDLTASRLIAPPRPRRRRDRAVASRAALFQATR